MLGIRFVGAVESLHAPTHSGNQGTRGGRGTINTARGIKERQKKKRMSEVRERIAEGRFHHLHVEFARSETMAASPPSLLALTLNKLHWFPISPPSYSMPLSPSLAPPAHTRSDLFS